MQDQGKTHRSEKSEWEGRDRLNRERRCRREQNINARDLPLIGREVRDCGDSLSHE